MRGRPERYLTPAARHYRMEDRCERNWIRRIRFRHHARSMSDTPENDEILARLDALRAEEG